jgi:hypothetical protein
MRTPWPTGGCCAKGGGGGTQTRSARKLKYKIGNDNYPTPLNPTTLKANMSFTTVLIFRVLHRHNLSFRKNVVKNPQPYYRAIYDGMVPFC